MPDIPLQDIDSIQDPKRRPWIIVLVILAAAGVWFWRENRADTPAARDPEETSAASAPETEPATPAAAPTPAATVPAPAATGARSSGAPAAVPATASATASRLLQAARAAEARIPQDSNATAEARRAYLDAIKAGLEPRVLADAEARLGKLSVDLALTPLPMPGVKVTYVVKSGDSIEKIARRLGTTQKLIERSNQIANPNRIKVGDRFNVMTGTFAVSVSKGRKDLVVTLNGEFFKRYLVATGKFGKTPTGTFIVRDKIVEPPWWRPDGKEVPYGDPENILGTRWMAIKATGETPDVRGYGIHGTWDDNSIGKEESAGCIRMRNAEVEELYDLLPLETAVTITD